MFPLFFLLWKNVALINYCFPVSKISDFAILAINQLVKQNYNLHSVRKIFQPQDKTVKQSIIGKLIKEQKKYF